MGQLAGRGNADRSGIQAGAEGAGHLAAVIPAQAASHGLVKHLQKTLHRLPSVPDHQGWGPLQKPVLPLAQASVLEMQAVGGRQSLDTYPHRARPICGGPAQQQSGQMPFIQLGRYQIERQQVAQFAGKAEMARTEGVIKRGDAVVIPRQKQAPGALIPDRKSPVPQ